MRQAWNPEVTEESQKQVAKLQQLGWYHSIELPDGGVIQGLLGLDQLKGRLRHFPIPNDLTGKRVLDIGAWDGFYSFEMERRGAQVVAVDSARNTRFLEARKVLGSRVEYHIADICRLSPEDVGYFDIVLFFGVLYHVKHPVLALENVCRLATDFACVESFVTGGDPNGQALMEFYEGSELRGQLDNWVGPNTACLLAFCRAAGFASAHLESVVNERAHVTCFRKWPEAPGTDAPPQVTCVANAVSDDHSFSERADDYVSFYFSSPRTDLTRENVFPEIGTYGSYPMHVARQGEGWQVSCKLPPGLGHDWHSARLRTDRSGFSSPVRIGIDVSEEERARGNPNASDQLQINLVTDGVSWTHWKVVVGTENSSLSVWVDGLPDGITANEIRLRFNGTDLPATFISATPVEHGRQVNALLPKGIQPQEAWVSVVVGDAESSPVAVRLIRPDQTIQI